MCWKTFHDIKAGFCLEIKNWLFIEMLASFLCVFSFWHKGYRNWNFAVNFLFEFSNYDIWIKISFKNFKRNFRLYYEIRILKKYEWGIFYFSRFTEWNYIVHENIQRMFKYTNILLSNNFRLPTCNVFVNKLFSILWKFLLGRNAK